MIAQCTCDHKGQDALHGAKNRVHNEVNTESAGRCTVCLKNNPIPKSQFQTDDKKKKK